MCHTVLPRQAYYCSQVSRVCVPSAYVKRRVLEMDSTIEQCEGEFQAAWPISHKILKAQKPTKNLLQLDLQWWHKLCYHIPRYISVDKRMYHGLYKIITNRPFHVRLMYVQGHIIERDITSRVHSSAILEYFTIAVNGK